MFNEVGGNIALSGVSLVDSAGAGINIDGGTGTIRFAGTTTIEGAAADAIRIQNSDADIEFESLVIRDAAGAGISIFNNESTGSFTVSGHTLIDGTGEQGIAIRDNEGTVTFDSVEIDGRGQIGIYVDGTAGEVLFDGDVAVANSEDSTQSAIKVSNSEADIVFDANTTIENALGNAGVELADNTGRVGFVNLDITADGAAGVLGRNGGSLTITDGNVTVENAAAFDIEGSETDISLTSVRVDGGDVGIRLKDTTGGFIINGDPTGIAESGGLIENTTTAIFAENAGVIGLRNMVLNNNVTGVNVTGTERFTMWNSSVTGSDNFAITAANVETFQIVSSDFSDNDGTFQWAANDEDVATNWVLSDVTVDSGSAPALTFVGTNEAQIELAISDSRFTSILSDSDLVNVTADGRLGLTILGNQFQSSGSDVTLFNVNSRSTDQLLEARIFDNLFATTGTSATGLAVTTDGQSQLLIDQNVITFGAGRGIGMDLDLASSSTVGLYTNTITDNFDGATGVLFRSITGPSQIEIINNDLSFANLGGLSDRGFIFNSVTGDVNLIGTTDNTVSGASTVYSIPSGTTTGFFLINGVPVP